MIAQWIGDYGYWAVLFGTLLEGETIVVLAGYAAHRGYLLPSGVAVAAFVGSFAGDQISYLLGARFHDRLLSSRSSSLRIARVRAWFERHSIAVMIGFRFVYGIRNITPFAIGTMNVKARTFAPLNALGALIWAPLFTGLGYAFGQVASVVFERAREYEELFMTGIVAAGAVVAVLHAVRQRSRNRRIACPSRHAS